MKTATITYHNVYNYGAVLQAYALQQVQLGMAISNVIIDHSLEKKYSGWRLRGRSPFLFLLSLLRLLATLLHYLAIRRQRSSFDRFIRDNLILTSPYKDFKALRSHPPKADLYLAGGDQLWNVSQSIKRAFFLDFGGSKVRRASYSVSMGSCHIAPEKLKGVQKLLGRFTAISVREEEAKSLLAKILEPKADIHVNFDSVFLLTREEWNRLSHPGRIQGKYILCFPMGDRPVLNYALRKLKRLTGYRTVLVTTEIILRIQADIKIRDASPEEFLSLIRNAEYVLTSSFHGTAFSILFERKFFTYSGGSLPGRMIGLLDQLGLKDRLFDSPSRINTSDIDYDYCNEIIGQERSAAMEYLLSVLKS